MRKALAILAMMLFGVALAAQTAPATSTAPIRRPTIRQRQRLQQHRIGQGIRSGQLTAGETARLERREARLNRKIARDRRDGGGLSMQERRQINRQQNRMSRQIYRAKHNRRHQ